jgi:hypothetical protein
MKSIAIAPGRPLTYPWGQPNVTEDSYEQS